MSEAELQPAVQELAAVVGAYLRERVVPHPILNRYLPDAAACVTGSVALGMWDEQSPVDLTLLIPDEQHARLSAELRQARLWDPARDFRLRLRDREPFRRYPGANLLFLSTGQLHQQFAFDLPVALWTYTHALPLQDPAGTLEAALRRGTERFQEALGNLRCQHYYRFRQARNDLLPRHAPGRVSTLQAIKRGEAVQEALRLAFLADGKPYPYDKWLEAMAERETTAGSGIVTAVRALIAAREPETIEHAGKVLRDRVAFALQQGGISERWLEQWWLWPYIAPGE